MTIRYDPRDAAELRVYHHDQYLCRAIAPELAADAVTLQQLQQARTARRKQLKQQLRERRSLVDALPIDERHLPPPAPAAVAVAASGRATEGTAADPRPRHGLRTYAAD